MDNTGPMFDDVAAWEMSVMAKTDPAYVRQLAKAGMLLAQLELAGEREIEAKRKAIRKAKRHAKWRDLFDRAMIAMAHADPMAGPWL